MELIIKVDNENIHLSPATMVSIHQSNIPIEHCKFRRNEDIFWRVDLVDYDDSTNCWKMKVVDYSVQDPKNFSRQKSTRKVDRLEFEPFDWLGIKRHLTSYTKIKLHHMLINPDATEFVSDDVVQKSIPISSRKENSTLELQYLTADNLTEYQPKIETKNYEFSVAFVEASFRRGHVVFNKKVKGFEESLEFHVHNDYILAEFDNIKQWFAKSLKSKKFNVQAVITTADGKLREISARSVEIEMIDVNLIESVKFQRTIALTKAPNLTKADKTLFTSDEIFKEIETTSQEGNALNQTESEILGILIDKHQTRNRKQLEYLSSTMQSERSKLRFTLYPNFGFLFFVEGRENNHFVWELLNSHATYIWSIDKSKGDLEVQYQRIQVAINIIRESGREQYKHAYKQKKIDNDLIFSLIEHESSELLDGFIKWKHKLNEKLT